MDGKLLRMLERKLRSTLSALWIVFGRLLKRREAIIIGGSLATMYLINGTKFISYTEFLLIMFLPSILEYILEFGHAIVSDISNSSKPLIPSSAIIKLEEKKRQLQSKLNKPAEVVKEVISVQRTKILKDSVSAIRAYYGLHKLNHLRLIILFKQESGVDGGGLSREWFVEVSKALSGANVVTAQTAISEDHAPIFQPQEGNNYNLSLAPQFSLNSPIFSIAKVTKTVWSWFSKSIAKPATASDTSSKPTSAITREPKVVKFNQLKTEGVEVFKFAGYFLAKAIYENQLIHGRFSKLFYKLLCKLEVTLLDMEQEDPTFYKNLMSILEIDLDSVELGLVFSIEETLTDGNRIFVELIPQGNQVAVTNINKHEYVTLVLQYKYETRLKAAIAPMQEGFEEVMPLEYLHSFSYDEFNMLLSGLPYIDISNWRGNTAYASGYTPLSLQIIWFWRIVEQMTEDDRCQLLQFVTGSSHVPPGGFSQLKGMQGTTHLFTICRSQKEPAAVAYSQAQVGLHLTPARSSERLSTQAPSQRSSKRTYLPEAHTCYNTLHLPEYESMEEERKMLLLAIREGGVFDLK